MKPFTLDYFIKFFESMDDDMYCFTYQKDSSLVAQADAWEWLSNDEQEVLYSIIKPYGMLVLVNNGVGEYVNLGATIKDRVVNFLKHIVKMRTYVA